MDDGITINEFDRLMQIEEDESLLLRALQKLMTIEKAEDILVAIVRPDGAWYGWN